MMVKVVKFRASRGQSYHATTLGIRLRYVQLSLTSLLSTNLLLFHINSPEVVICAAGI